MFREAGLDEKSFGLDAFHILADHSLYQRFDRFNARYSPWRRAEMRTIFLKSSNAMEGRFFGELTRRCRGPRVFPAPTLRLRMRPCACLVPDGQPGQTLRSQDLKLLRKQSYS